MADQLMLRVRHLRLRAQTGKGLFGADLPMSDGLMVVRAENSRGKSTAVQSILFALGLERMITTRPTSALTSAMRDRLIYDAQTKAETPVVSSWVSVELEGAGGTVATVTRWVVNESQDSGLVRVAHGGIDDDGPQLPVEDYYVGRSGGATNPRGFHSWLANFIGWEMPVLPARDGRSAPLYMEQVFPLLFVEQRRGWGGIQAQMPYFSGVAEVRKRAIEFLLDLDVGKNELERQRLKAAEDEVHLAWHQSVGAFAELLETTGLRMVAVPENLDLTWPAKGTVPRLAGPTENDQWRDIGQIIAGLEAASAEQEYVDVGTLSADRPEIAGQLRDALNRLGELRTTDAALREDIVRDGIELGSIRERLEYLREDLRQHQDVATLERLGSHMIQVLHEDCPVCHQSLPESLLPTDVPTMTAAESVDYIKQQIELFESMMRDSSRTLAAKRERWAVTRQESDSIAATARALRESVLAPTGMPSVADITRRVELRQQLRLMRSHQERFFELFGKLERLVARAVLIRAELKAVPKDRLTESDRRKLAALKRSFLEQLREYEFGSFSDEMLDISGDDYLPRRDQFDLQADISASDSIRVIWAYLLGLVEVGELANTNHPGFLVFDEPRQQSAKDVSFAALLKRAAQKADRQIVFATSEDLPRLKQMLSGLKHHLHVVDGYLLTPITGVPEAGDPA